MSENSFNASIARSISLIDSCGLLAHVNSKIHLPSDYVTHVRDLSYKEEWEVHNNRHWYHVKFTDQSLLFFKPDSFKYFMAPFSHTMSLEEYEQNEIKQLIDEGYTIEDATILVSSDLEKDYSDYVDTETTIKTATPIRLDIHPTQYHATHHPVTHMHLGHENESRLPVKKIMTPDAFSSFIIATFYPDKWKLLLNKSNDEVTKITSIKNNLKNVPHEFSDKWCPIFEETRFYLS